MCGADGGGGLCHGFELQEISVDTFNVQNRHIPVPVLKFNLMLPVRNVRASKLQFPQVIPQRLRVKICAFQNGT